MDWQDDPHQCGSAQSVGARELVRVCRTGAVLSWERVSLLHWRSYCGQFSLFYPSAFPLSGTATALGCGVWGVLLTSLATAVTGRNVGEEKFILALGLRLQSMSLREHGGRCLSSGRRV